jgi:hypothetical protein
MKLLIRLLHVCIGGCRHQHTYRERRELYGVQILHFVCEDCGHAAPALARTAEEHQQIVQAGALKPFKARRFPVEVLALSSRRRHLLEPRRAVN